MLQEVRISELEPGDLVQDVRTEIVVTATKMELVKKEGGMGFFKFIEGDEGYFENRDGHITFYENDTMYLIAKASEVYDEIKDLL